MDSGNMSEVENEVEQPAEAVAAEAEVNPVEPQTGDDETELYIEEEGDQQDEPKAGGMTDEQAKAAFRQEREKRKAKAKQNEELQLKLEQQAKELEKLKETVGKVTKGPRPSILDYASDDDFFAALDEWNGKAQEAKPEQQSAKTEAAIDLSEDQAWHLHKNEEEIKKSFSDYDDVKTEAKNAFKSAGVDNTELAMKQIAAICHEHDINTGKVNYAIGKFPQYADKLAKAAATNQAAVRTVLRELEGKVQSRTRKKINSEPEPKIKGNGSVNVGSEAERKAWDAYTNASSGDKIAAYKELQKIRKANKANK